MAGAVALNEAGIASPLASIDRQALAQTADLLAIAHHALPGDVAQARLAERRLDELSARGDIGEEARATAVGAAAAVGAAVGAQVDADAVSTSTAARLAGMLFFPAASSVLAVNDFVNGRADDPVALREALLALATRIRQRALEPDITKPAVLTGDALRRAEGAEQAVRDAAAREGLRARLANQKEKAASALLDNAIADFFKDLDLDKIEDILKLGAVIVGGVVVVVAIVEVARIVR